MTSPILEAKNISKRFGDFRALSDMSIALRPRTVHALIGPNGAGKTTYFNILSGVMRPTSGEVIFEGKPVTPLQIHERLHRGMARSFQVTNIFQSFTVHENVRLAVQAVIKSEPAVFWRGLSSRASIQDRVEALLDLTGLQGAAGKRAGDLSHGAQRTLEIAMTVASKPKLVFLDEPLAGMSIDDIHRSKQLIHSLARDMTVVLIEHNMNVVMDISDCITVMAQGRKIAEGTPDQIRAEETVRKAYLGSRG
ncbi:ABC transporter ATP-binding protein [Paralcaligenes ureilyticus]|uniref:Amino acid/amide ABC transporter ATP-binding protein 1 (HAAT family) n=1 Tax=Paralcaligenes ureilyticus TaxID=627131 RepID=A0A4R3M827_9BURK|nr:ABC transporter ATP-binding protein [Paralcaligenes ureilyticus]TCT09661.1 amino acid/amide ABC transporter ATP-binding protein 1 (HAAT family) [Paralcaligenes ureilyticus]